MAPSSKNTSAAPRPREKRSRSRATSPTPTATATATATATTATPTATATATAAATPTGSTAYLHTPQSSLIPQVPLIEALMDKNGSNSSSPPSAQSLHALHDSIKSQMLAPINTRSEACEKSVRDLVRKKKHRQEQELERERQEQEQERKRIRLAKKREEEQRPPAVGAHGLARQDGVDVHKGTPPPESPSAQVAAATSALEKNSSSSPAPSDAGHQPPPAASVAHYETFGNDPTEFDDPTIYHIRDWTDDMSDDQKKEIFSVARFPHDDLHDLTPGTPPDMDFSIAKPTSQINFSTFQAYVEPYIRPLTEEDVAFLKERGDRVTPFIIPSRGAVPYKELWAKEDGVSHHDFNFRQPPNEPRGSIQDMNDDIAETSQISAGPLVSRFLATLRHEPHESKDDQSNGDVSMTNGETTAGAEPDPAVPNPDESDAVASFKPASYFPEPPGSKPLAMNTGRDFAPLEQRTLQELRYIGIVTPESTPDYDAQYDDEVAARLRYLQSELQRVSRENASRKARVLELTEERMAMQEYSTIADDLDTQINTAYLKRNRTMSKPKKGAGKARPGQSGTGGVAMSRNVVSEGVKMLMDRRKAWRDLIGPVVDYGQKRIPKETVFDKENMTRLEKVEAEAGGDEGE